MGRARDRKGRGPAGAAAMLLVLLLVGVAPAGELVQGPAEPIVFTQLPLQAAAVPATGASRADYGAGGRIVRLDPDGAFTVLTTGFESACGCDVSFEGERILFSGRRRAGEPWNIFEMLADGSAVRQITKGAGNCRSPAYQATLYTIVSTEPWYEIMFVSDRGDGLTEYGTGPARHLYSCRLDGTGLRRLTLNLSDDLDPLLMDDGRVLLASWRRRDLQHGYAGRWSLFGVNTDGADYALYSAGGGAHSVGMPCETADGLVVYVEAGGETWDGAGRLAAVTTRRPMHSYQPIAADANYVYHSPARATGGAVLVSRRPANGTGSHALGRLDPHSGAFEPIWDDPAWHDVHARRLGPRRVPDGRSSVVNEKYPTGKLYCLNAYQMEPALHGQLAAGEIRQVRVLEGVAWPAGAKGGLDAAQRRAYAGALTGPGASRDNLAGLAVRRVLGVAPVHEDGSFQIEVPADVAIELQTLDANGMALRSCGWIWAKHREPRGCIGCHEDPELTPENRFVLAVQQPAVQLTLPPERRRTVTFERDVWPIVEAKCSDCHHGGGAGPELTGASVGAFNQAYISLLERGGDDTARVRGRYVDPGQARTSPLIWRLVGRCTARPWDGVAGEAMGRCPPDGTPELTAGERLTFIEWVDLGAAWSDTTLRAGAGEQEGRE